MTRTHTTTADFPHRLACDVASWEVRIFGVAGRNEEEKWH